MSLQPGHTFAGYSILRLLGAGGMGAVYLAGHPRLAREDALKVLPAEFTGDPEYRARFTREAELAAGLSHPHIVGIQDRGEHDGQLWISMDYVPGTDADRLLDERYQSGMPVDEVVPIVAAVASALDYAHLRGLLHRDVKPANILLSDPDGQGRRIYLADFGIARRLDDSARLTATNIAVGTVAYTAPEQLRGDPVDARADQYALACTAFHLLTGELPYPDANPTVVITQHVFAPPPSIGVLRPELAGLDPVFQRAMAKEPSGRFSSCGEFATQLRSNIHAAREITTPAHVVPTEPPAVPTIVRRRRGVLVGALVAVAVLIGAGVIGGSALTRESTTTTTASTTARATTATTTVAATTPTPATPGPLDGTYRADFGAATDLDGHGKGAGPATATYGLRSACRGESCVAAASNLGSGAGFAVNLVFDEFGGHWVAVALVTDQCRTTPTEFWHVFSLQLNPDGILIGELTRTSANTCRDRRSVTFTRTGDLNDAPVADPAALPPRVPSPAEALHGRYDRVRTFVAQGPGQTGDATVTTVCLRTGERCMSYLHGSTGDTPLVFANGSWALNAESDYQCPAGGTTHFSAVAQFPLPQPTPDPILSLIGHGHQEQTGLCAVNTAFDETLTRIGD